MNKDIKEVVSYVVKDQWKFDTLEEAESFCEDSIFYYDTYDDGWDAVDKKDVEKYKDLYVRDKDEFYNLYYDLGNSNSMGALYPLNCMSIVIDLFEEK